MESVGREENSVIAKIQKSYCFDILSAGCINWTYKKYQNWGFQLVQIRATLPIKQTILQKKELLMNRLARTRSVVITAFFAAMVYLGIQVFRIPMPAAVGTPFLHFGHIFVVLAILCLGPKGSAIAGVLGLVIFDVLNAYMHAIPNVVVCTLIECLSVGSLFLLLKRGADGNIKKEYCFAVLCAVVYGLLNIVLDFIWNTASLVIMGSSVSAAITAELTSIPATVINSVFMVVGIAALYPPVKAAYCRAVKG